MRQVELRNIKVVNPEKPSPFIVEERTVFMTKTEYNIVGGLVALLITIITTLLM